MGIIYILFKGLYHLHKMRFKVIVLLFRCVRYLGLAIVGKLGTDSAMRTALASIDYVLELAFHHLFFSGINWLWCPGLDQSSP